MKQYHSQVSSLYLGNPETTSMMILTLLEFWVACDKCACANLPMLAEYDPGLHLEHLHLFILPMRDHMVRLRQVQEYLEARRQGALDEAPGSIFTEFGKDTSFSVRFFDQSSKHHELRQLIERDADNKVQKKKEELAALKERYYNLMRLYEMGDCGRVSRTNHLGDVSEVHGRKCHRCSYRATARKIAIDVYEWPLPQDSGSLKSVVFELDPPSTFCEW